MEERESVLGVGDKWIRCFKGRSKWGLKSYFSKLKLWLATERLFQKKNGATYTVIKKQHSGKLLGVMTVDLTFKVSDREWEEGNWTNEE